MRKLTNIDRELVYNAPIIDWDTDTYTPLANKTIMDMVEDKISSANLTIKSQEYKVATTQSGLVRGVIGSYNISTNDNEFGQRIMFRNSYDKSMSFAFVVGSLCWICTNGCISGDFQYKRVHRGVLEGVTSTTEKDVIANIDGGFNMLQKSFEHNVAQMNELKHFEIGPDDSYKLLGALFFTMKVLTINQMSIVKKELEGSKNFRHLDDKHFTAFDLYQHITEALKTSHPYTYINDHVETHSLFESTFGV